MSTGGSDWIDSSGEAVKVEGRLPGHRSQDLRQRLTAGAVLVTSARYEDPRREPWRCTSPCR